VEPAEEAIMKPAALRAGLLTICLGSMLAAARLWSEYDSRSGLVAYMNASRGAGSRPPDGSEAEGEARIAALRRALWPSSVTGEIRSELALEQLAAANRILLAGSPTPASDRGASRRLDEAFAESAQALLANPTDTKSWLTGFRIVESAKLLGHEPILSSASAHGGPSRSVFLDGAIRTNPNSGELRHGLAGVMVAAGDQVGAFEQFRLALEDPAVEPGQIAEEMFDAGFLPERILEIMPQHFDAQYALGDLLTSRGYSDLGEKTLRAAARLSPESSEPWIALSRLAESSGRHAEALADALKPLDGKFKTTPQQRSEAFLAASTASRSLGHLDDALAYAAKALDENTQNLSLYYTIGSLMYEAHDFNGATRYWQSLLDDHAEDPYVRKYAGLIHRGIGQALERSGDRQGAGTHYFAALEIDPGDRQARAALDRLAGDSAERPGSGAGGPRR
jgi:tetratricopeptide (TPR) repeat protein